MIDTSFIAAFANNPLTLTILMLAGIVGLFIWKVSPYFKDLLSRVDKGNSFLSEKVDNLLKSDSTQSEMITAISDHVRCNTLDVLRITIYNESVDIEDRLVAARRYFIRGGNGKVAGFVRTLIDQNTGIWRAIIAMSSDADKELLEKALQG
jgi:hypothetical protein